MESESPPVTRTANPVMAVQGSDGVRTLLYKCNECKALLFGIEDARDHLWWHDRLVHIK